MKDEGARRAIRWAIVFKILAVAFVAVLLLTRGGTRLSLAAKGAPPAAQTP